MERFKLGVCMADEYPKEHKFGDPYFCSVCGEEVPPIKDSMSYGTGKFIPSFGYYVVCHWGCFEFLWESLRFCDGSRTVQDIFKSAKLKKEEHDLKFITPKS
jgi:hypothetical protein